MKLLSAIVRVCTEWFGIAAPDVYRDGWERPDPDEFR